MQKQLQTWQLINNSLAQQVPVMLLYVLQSAGSSPGRQGFFMAVNAAGDMHGSIGGGIMEHKFVEMAKEALKAQDTRHKTQEGTAQDTRDKESSSARASADKQGPSIRKQVHNKSAARNQSGMICSGEQTILLYPVQPEDAHTIQQVIACLQQRQNGLLQLSPTGLYFEADRIPSKDYLFTMQSDTDWLYQEKLGYRNRLLIIGGGHCALALSQIMSLMDFYIHVFDERTNLPTLEQNVYAHEKTIVNDYHELQEKIPPGENLYIVVMTVGYRTDDIVVRTLLDKPSRYFGILGSKAKIDQLFASYRLEGIAEEKLQAIHAPIGLSIKSETPEEIAISIAAEIIQIKNKNA
jgi:xanthine dehydrogenase accessory factor